MRRRPLDDYYDLGSYGRPVATTSADAQVWFDRGLNWTYGYNQDEAVRCFERALDADATCAMAHWGLAYVQGPYLNKEWRFYSEEELATILPAMYEGALAAVELAADGDPVEHALAEALTARYPSPEAPDLDGLTSWDDEYAAAMVRVHERFPDDPDVIALCAEALMMRTPWKLWDLDTGEPAAGASTMQLLDLLERGAAEEARSGRAPHPGIAHMTCHALEMSTTPELALPAADALRGLAAGNGHLLHMPGHIDVLCGDYAGAVATSERAIAADLDYLDEVGPFGQYTAAICHDNHLMLFASMLLGRWQPAIDAADLICEIVTDEVLERSTPAFRITLESYVSMRMHAFVRFGRWREILQQEPPGDPELYPVSTAMHHYARAIAHASLGGHLDASREATFFDRTLAAIPVDRHLFNNTSHTVLAVAAEMMAGELAYHRGDHEPGLGHLRRAVVLNDELNYTEPWAWMHPPRHALGALLLEQGQVEEAETVYLADLGLAGSVRRANVHPDNVWSLHGYVECRRRLGATDGLEEITRRLDAALAHVDVSIASSCACRGAASSD